MNVFETLRERVPLEEIVGPRSDVRANRVHCVAPDHNDANPSMHLYEERVHCFSCGFHGDVVDMWAAMRGFDRPIEAALDLARKYGVELPERDPEAERRAEERRRHEADCFREAEARHEALEQHVHVREWWCSRGFDEEFQRRCLLGASADGRAATIPYWHRGRVQVIIRRQLEGQPKYVLPTADTFPEGHKPLFIPGHVRPGTYIVEGFIDALALDALGESVVAVGGTDPNEAQLRELMRLPGELHVRFDADDAGTDAARKLARELYPRARVCLGCFGEGLEDPANLFAVKGKEALEILQGMKKASEDLMDIETAAAAELGDPRRRLDYAVERIVPLACELHSETAQEAALDIVSQKLDSVKLAWLKKALKEEQQRRQDEELLRVTKTKAEATIEARRRYLTRVQAVADEIAEIFARLGVLERFQKDAAEMHGVVGDQEAIKLIALVALGAQLAPLPNGRPLGSSVLLTAPPGRGKNYLIDAVVRLLPESFYVAFEVASSQAFYFTVENDPEYLRHKFVYPNEIEAVDALVNFLRPMLSSGKAVKFTVNKDISGANVAQELEVDGPITTAVPTIRNKTDDQLHTRLLVGELSDYVGRVKRHSAAFSELLLPDYAAADYSHKLFLWHAGLRQLAERRRVVFPLQHPNFALDNDDLSHGSRAWANLLGLMCTHAWLEQHNRKKMVLATGEEAVIAEPADYWAAYEIFKQTCARTVVNLSKAHRKILDAVYSLGEEEPERDGFSQRRVAEEAGISQSTVSSNKTFLVHSAKLLVETEEGLALVAGAEPSWWEKRDVMSGIPTPEEVEEWWESSTTSPERGGGGADHIDHIPYTSHSELAYDQNGDRQGDDHDPITDRLVEGATIVLNDTDHDRRMIGEHPIARNGSNKADSSGQEGAIGAITRSTGVVDNGKEQS
jgi:DNA primase/transcriptional regulator with XRE-family HTH domain